MMSERDNQPVDPAHAGCRQFDLNLSALLEGEARPDVLAHARECPFCGVVLADLNQIRAASNDLAEPEPSAGLWANIRATLVAEGLIHEPVPFWQHWLPQLTIFQNPRPIGALAGLALLALALLLSPRGYETPSPSGIMPAGESITAAGFLPPELSPDLTRTLKEMEEAYHAQEGSFEPALKATYRKSLAALDATIQECVRHCQRDPDNALARDFLMNAYRTKAEVLASALEFKR